MESAAAKTTTSNAEVDRDDEVDEELFSYAAQLVFSSSLPMVLNAAIQLDVLEIIAEAGPGAQLSPTEIASRITSPSKNPDAPIMLDRMLRLLTSHSVVTCSLVGFERVYGLAPVAKYLVRNQDGISLGPLMALVHDKIHMDSWYKLNEAVMEGGVPFDKVHGAHAFEYPGTDPRYSEVFNKGMVNHTTIVIKKILQRYHGLQQLKQVVDVGGGLGVTLNMIVSKHPTIKGINFDLPHVIRQAPAYPGTGIEHVGGDMFESVPGGDAIFLKWILHDWGDHHCLKLLKNCYEALPDNGKVIVVESILPVVPDTSAVVKTTSQLDLMMMTLNPGGKERTKQEFLTLAKAAGFTGIRLECFTCNFWVMEFYK